MPPLRPPKSAPSGWQIQRVDGADRVSQRARCRFRNPARRLPPAAVQNAAPLTLPLRKTRMLRRCSSRTILTATSLLLAQPTIAAKRACGHRPAGCPAAQLNVVDRAVEMPIAIAAQLFGHVTECRRRDGSPASAAAPSYRRSEPPRWSRLPVASPYRCPASRPDRASSACRTAAGGE